jgi:phosphatidylglycerol:prolipoprotein diacylglycerol transferase
VAVAAAGHIADNLSHSLVTFPVYIRIGSVRLHPHFFFETLAFVVAFLLFLGLRRSKRDHLSDDLRWWVITAAIVGAAIGCRLLGWLETPHVPLPGKTVVGGIIGGIFAVELTKKRFGVKAATGDLFAIPIALGIAVGRIGCFLTGLSDDTYGTVTTLPWGVDFGDGIRRHPTQIYEMVFLLVLVPLLMTFWRRQSRQGATFKLFAIAYMAWRFLIDFLKPGNRVLSLSAIQLACLLMLLYYSRGLVRIAGSLAQRGTPAER